MAEQSAATAIAVRYRRFGEVEVGSRSPQWAALATGIADDPTSLRFIASLPAEKRQPNLVMAAARSVLDRVPTAVDFLNLASSRTAELHGEIMRRRTQTNEPGRCATLLPLLTALPQPLALLEIGCSAGLCLWPDRYGYDFGTGAIRPPSGAAAPLFPCRLTGVEPPTSLPRIVWRGGIDLHPLDPGDADTRRWLRMLVWPDQEARTERLTAALALAAREAEAARIVKGDVQGAALDELVSEARASARGATLVIMHSAVLTYIGSSEARSRVARRLSALADVWISNEGPHVLAELADGILVPTAHASDFLLSQDGRPRFWADPHGAALHAL